MNKQRMLKQIEFHEEFHAELTEKDTIGIGYDIASRGVEFFGDVIARKLGPHPVVTLDEARKVALADIDRIERATLVRFPEYAKLNEVRQRVVISLAFKALDCAKLMAAIKQRNWSQATRELYRMLPDERDLCYQFGQMLLTGLDS